MAVFQDYTSGTVSVANGETTVTGDSTAWSMADIRAGDTFMRAGFVVAIASVDSDTSLTLSEPWPGTTLAGSEYRIRYQPDGSRYTAAARALIEQLGESALAAFADLEGAENTLPFFTGPDAMDLTAFPPYSRALLAATTAGGALDELGISAFIQTLLDDADAEAARQTLGANDASNLTQGTLPDGRVSTNLPPNKAYRQGNVLGTVSESGGVPTGAIIESGSNANGDYTLFASGLAICSATVSVDLTKGTNQIFPLPVNFSHNPVPAWGPSDEKFGTDVNALQAAFIDVNLDFGANWRWRCDGSGTTTSSLIVVGAYGRMF